MVFLLILILDLSIASPLPAMGKWSKLAVDKVYEGCMRGAGKHDVSYDKKTFTCGCYVGNLSRKYTIEQVEVLQEKILEETVLKCFEEASRRY